MIHELTDQQQAILDYVKAGKGSLIVEALAGSGKTFTIKQALTVIPQATAIICAFNKPIADELQATLPGLPKGHVVHVKTFHALGLSILKKHYPRLEVTKTATHELINKSPTAQMLPFNAKRVATKLLTQLKDSYASKTPPKLELIIRLGLDFNLFGKLTALIDKISEVVREAYVLSLDMPNRQSISYCDMIWAPVALDLAPPSRYKAAFIDELQDISSPQFSLMQKVLVEGGRFIGVGDKSQQIYAFRGSLGRLAWQQARDLFDAKSLPLTTCFRCSQSVVLEARRIVPSIRPASNAIVGSVSMIPLGKLSRSISGARSDVIHTFILSRTNAALLDVALYLWNEHVAFTLKAGNEIFEPLFDLIDGFNVSSSNAFHDDLNRWSLGELTRAELTGSTTWADTVEQQVKMLMTAVAHTHPRQIKSLLTAMLRPNSSGVMLSTVHKVKGLEADRVFLLRDTFASGKVEVDGGYNGGDEENNIEYVAITRAREHLTWVSMGFGDTVDVEEMMLKQAGQDLSTLNPEQLHKLFSYAEQRASDALDRLNNETEAEYWFNQADRLNRALGGK